MTIAAQISFALETGPHMKPPLRRMKQALLVLVPTWRVFEWFLSTSEEDTEATSDYLSQTSAHRGPMYSSTPYFPIFPAAFY